MTARPRPSRTHSLEGSFYLIHDRVAELARVRLQSSERMAQNADLFRYILLIASDVHPFLEVFCHPVLDATRLPILDVRQIIFVFFLNIAWSKA